MEKVPDETNIKIFENLLIIRLDGALTPIEEALLSMPEGENAIYKLRETLISQRRDYYLNWIESICKAKPEGVRFLLSNEDKKIYLFIVFKESIDPSKKSSCEYHQEK